MPISLVPLPEHYYQTEAMIFNKIRAGIPLTVPEKYMHCNCLPDTALISQNCYDELFTRLYWQTKPHFREEVIRIANKGKERLMFEEMVYKVLLQDWEKEIVKPNVSDPLLRISNKETNIELQHLSREAILKVMPAHDLQRKRQEIIAWSKYRYISAKLISDILFTNGIYETELDGNRIILDLESLMHIISRHYAENAKLYSHRKSHFNRDFYHEDLPMQLQFIFSKIDISGLFKGQLTGKNGKIIFCFRGITYDLFLKQTGGKKYRIVTFYPVDESRYNVIVNAYSMHNIDQELSLFIEK